MRPLTIGKLVGFILILAVSFKLWIEITYRIYDSIVAPAIFLLPVEMIYRNRFGINLWVAAVRVLATAAVMLYGGLAFVLYLVLFEPELNSHKTRNCRQ